VAHAEHGRTALVWCVVYDACLQVHAGSRQHAKLTPCPPEGIVGDDRQRGVVGTLRQAQQRLPKFSRRMPLCPCILKPPQPKEDRDQLWRLTHLLTQRVCLVVGVFHLGRCVPFGYLQSNAEGNM
jgi:hypothetical protein